ncbi:selenocysteinyl-tRNA-specific translation factor [[Pantoea] beijingensis]|uniref:Selenocysteine-specific elongation factor n=1 Tax=[Pantoea] beijingensis TaxID=1324864 RepID=A0A443IGV5_9GAMM|nr:selenocysteine-specific translation elongation factor [[Pantoea] beijingensis]RWR03289.1 selenocysteinyl-tRNA-specific translation factor [[Pantoea] beijingensis]
MIIATAGHVDHGKTTLLQAITGVNADRLPEEKQRGMTIDLGYAYWPQPDGTVTGFIDVPGHEKFLANMLSGIGGIDHALLVVACDDGIMAQTREHLTILQLIGRPALSVALTKADRVDTERVAQVEQQVLALTQQLGWEDLRCFTTSTEDGRGIAELRDHLRDLKSIARKSSLRFRLAIDRAFSIKGAGLVVTGTALAGKVKQGDKLWLTGANKSVRVRGLHAQNQPTEHAQAGQRIALNLSGDVEKSDITRGDWLLEERQQNPFDRVIVAIEHTQPLKQWQPLHIHHAARHITGRVSLLADGLAELVLDAPLWLADNDRLILRDIGAQQTLGAARVVLLRARNRGKRQPDYLRWLRQLASVGDDAQTLQLRLDQQPCEVAELGWARQLTAHAMEELFVEVAPIVADEYLLSQQTAATWRDSLLAALTTFHLNHNDQPGPGRDRLRRIALPNQPAALVLALIDELVISGKIINRSGWLHLPGFEIHFAENEAEIWQHALALFDDQALWVRDIANALQEEELRVREVLRIAAQRGDIVAIVKDRYYRSEQITIFADLIRKQCAEQGSVNAADFRSQLNIGRKLAIQILEHFDRIGFTRRKGNEHSLRDSALFPLQSESKQASQ